MTTTTALMTPKDSFDRFGDDLAELMLQYLGIYDRLRLESVSKQWQSLIFNTQTHLEYNENHLIWSSKTENLKLIETVVKKFPNITSINVNNVFLFVSLDRLLDLLIKYCDQLRHISMELKLTDDWPVVEPVFDEFIDRFGQQLLTFKYDGYNEQFKRQLLYKLCDQRLSRLKTVDITGTISLKDLFTDSHFKGYRLPNGWQSFDVQLADKRSHKLFTKFTETYGQQMRSLNISVDKIIMKLSNTDWLSSEKMPQLRQLSLNFMSINDSNDLIISFFSRIGRNCRQLLKLHLKFIRADSNYIIGKILDTINENMSQLKHLSLIGNYVIHLADNSVGGGDDDDDDGDHQLVSGSRLNRMQRLTRLAIRVYTSAIIGDPFFANIDRNLPRLQSLSISKSSITIESLISLAKLPHLTDLQIWADTETLTTTQPIIENHLLNNRSKIKYLFIEYMDPFDGIKELKIGSIKSLLNK